MFIRNLTSKFIEWCGDNSAAAKLERTIAQGVIGVVIGLLSGLANAPEWVQVGLVPITMSVLAPIQAKIGKTTPAITDVSDLDLVAPAAAEELTDGKGESDEQ